MDFPCVLSSAVPWAERRVPPLSGLVVGLAATAIAITIVTDCLEPGQERLKTEKKQSFLYSL